MNSLYTDNNNIIIVNKSVILPITSGTINVDTTESITIFMKNPSKTDDILRIIVKVKIHSPACMNKGFIMDGYPKNTNDAVAVFLESITTES